MQLALKKWSYLNFSVELKNEEPVSLSFPSIYSLCSNIAISLTSNCLYQLYLCTFIQWTILNNHLISVYIYTIKHTSPDQPQTQTQKHIVHTWSLYGSMMIHSAIPELISRNISTPVCLSSMPESSSKYIFKATMRSWYNIPIILSVMRGRTVLVSLPYLRISISWIWSHQRTPKVTN